MTHDIQPATADQISGLVVTFIMVECPLCHAKPTGVGTEGPQFEVLRRMNEDTATWSVITACKACGRVTNQLHDIAWERDPYGRYVPIAGKVPKEKADG